MVEPSGPEQELQAREIGDDYCPTRIVQYTWGRESGSPNRPLLEFQWTAEEGVTVIVLDHDSARTAQRFMKQGANLEREKRMVLPDEGPVFMRALLGHGNSSSYYWFVDRTPGQP